MSDPGPITGSFLEDAEDEAGRHLTTLDGWRQFLADAPTPPRLLSASEYDRLSPLEQEIHEEARLDHHARLLVVATSSVRHTVTTGRRLVVLNRHAISARRGLIVSGPAGTGKTIAITQLGRSHELIDRARHPHRSDRIPVVYITVPPAATARMVAAEFGRFLNVPVRRGLNITDIIEAVVGVCTDARTGLVLVDELYNISLTTRHGAEVADTLNTSPNASPPRSSTRASTSSTATCSQAHGAPRSPDASPSSPPTRSHYGAEWKGLVAALEQHPPSCTNTHPEHWSRWTATSTNEPAA
ncbi:ATP-binding protein [Streptomyces sp. B21-102]|uniref:ATP-binding protein n=1 Tax=Streptomyces sp. B21-102 TaxID=3039416 RepID=UPI002FF2DF98